MKVKVDVNGEQVEITLTKEQVQHINEQSLTITDRVKTFEDACRIVGKDIKKIFTEYDSKFIKVCKKLEIIVLALNQGWKPNWKDSNEAKWFPHYKADDGVLAFRGSFFYGWSTGVGSCLYLKSEELSDYLQSQFGDILNDYYNS